MKRAWMLILLAAAGCVDLKASYPERRFYTLEAARPASSAGAGSGPVLRVRRFSASKLCDGTELVTRNADGTYDTDFYNVFFAPPSQQAMEQTARWLTQSGLYSSVVGSGSSVPESLILEGNLVALYGDAGRGDGPRAVIELQFLLVKVASDPASVLLQRTYRQEMVVLDLQPATMVKGWTEGLARILTALEADLAKAK